MKRIFRYSLRRLAVIRLAANGTELFFAERRGKGDREAFRALLTRDGGQPPQPGDEVPEGWQA